MRNIATTSIRALVAGLLAAVCLVAVTAPAPSGAQDCYPDGCPPPTDPPSDDDPTCAISVSTAQAGDQVTATVTDVPSGGTVRILFDGEEVGRTAATTADVSVTFTVPDVAPGHYSVVAVGDSFSVTCGSGSGAGLEVLSSSQGGGGSLPTTGISIGLLVTVALGLLVFGRSLLASSSSRRNAPTRSRAGA